jgi:hypothetical protein
MFKRISVINCSTVVPASEATKMVAACNIQLSRDVAGPWGRSTVPVTFYPKRNLAPAESAKIFIYDDSDQAGALGYHTVSGNQVWGTVFAKTILDYGCPMLYKASDKSNLTISSVLSHEVIELLVNPYVELWSEGPAINEGSEYAFEACDPVEADVYQITLPNSQGIVSVSNFVYPEYFNSSSATGTKLDYLNLLKRPFSMTNNGYMIVRSAPGSETAIYGAKYPEVLKKLNQLDK